MENKLQKNNLPLRFKKRLNFYMQKFNIKMSFLSKKEKLIENEMLELENKTRLQKVRKFIDKQN
jgi:hypothetical protein